MRHLNRYDKINLVNYYNRNEKHEKSPKQNWESNIRRTPIILGLSAALCMPSAFSYANASDPVAGELVQSVQQGRTVTGKIIDDTGNR